VTFVIAVIVFAIVEGLLIWITLRYRRRATDTELPKQTHGSNRLEVLWTIVPTVTVTALFIGALVTLNEQQETSAATPAVIVDVTGFQWQWTFDYPDHGVSLTGSGITGPHMAMPINELVRIRLHATDVIHSFYVPQFLYKLDAIPGRVNQFDVLVKEPGVYAGQCAEFCGLGHADMHFTVEAMPRADFDAWLVDQQSAEPSSAPPPPDAPTVDVTSVSVTEGFEPAELSVEADTPWIVQLTNADPAVPHDFAIRGANADGSDWQGDPDAQGGGSATYQPPPLAAAEYEFYCSIHPNMVGTLRAE
jgi:cytochrome c oxidase subunit 2